MGLTEQAKVERKERLAQNKKIHEVAELVAKAAATDTITAQLAMTIASLHCLKAWSALLADYR